MTGEIFLFICKGEKCSWNRIIPPFNIYKKRLCKKKDFIGKNNQFKCKQIIIYKSHFFFLLCFLRPILYHPFLFSVIEEKWEKENNISEISLFFCAEGWKIIKSAEVYDTMGSKQIIINFLYFSVNFF